MDNTDPEFAAEWLGRTQFAEIAETLGVSTDCVASALRHDSILLVIYSDDVSDFTVDTPAYAIALHRGPDGILAPTGPRREIPGFFHNLQEKMDEIAES